MCADPICTCCHRVAEFEDALDAAHKLDGLMTARIAELEASLGKAWRMAEEVRDGTYKPEGVTLVAAQICRDAEQVLTKGQDLD